MGLEWFMKAVIRYWWLVLLPLLAVGALTAYQAMTATPTAPVQYTTVVRFSATQSQQALPTRDGDFQDVWLSSELAVKALTSWAQTSSFRQEIAERLSQQSFASDLNTLSIAVDQERSIGQLFLTWNEPEELEQIATAALDVLQEDSQIYFPQFGAEPAQVTVLDDIVVTPVPPPIVDSAEPLVRLFLAFLVGVGLAVLAQYTDPALRTKDEVRRVGLEVLVSVPRE